MIRKTARVLICMIMLIAISGCGDNSSANNRTSNKPTGVEDALQDGIAKADSNSDAAGQQGEELNQNETESVTEDSSTEVLVTENLLVEDSEAEDAVSETDESGTIGNTEGVDIDLTSLTKTMVYSEVYNMMYAPQDYIGKTIKMEGLYSAYHDETTGNDYFACIIEDATACCSQGIEFQLTDDYVYPDDYPEEGSRITVIGVFDTYQEGEYKYCTLRNATLAD
ncbi:MAG: hypothetical protein ACI4EF_01605 [Coprococcus sp.]